MRRQCGPSPVQLTLITFSSSYSPWRQVWMLTVYERSTCGGKIRLFIKESDSQHWSVSLLVKRHQTLRPTCLCTSLSLIDAIVRSTTLKGHVAIIAGLCPLGCLQIHLSLYVRSRPPHLCINEKTSIRYLQPLTCPAGMNEESLQLM